MKDLRGYVHSIETFGTMDGPGIRCVVFLQGCPLRCLYCHNPDTRSVNGEGIRFSPKELTDEIYKYKHFFDASGGGVTVSGGEPTLQWKFLREFFKECKSRGIHTALDTSGFVDIDSAEAFLPYTDLVLLDIKHLNEERCIELTGKSNRKALDFLELLEQKNIPVIIRQVIVAGWTDSPQYIDSLIAFLKQYSCINKVEALPFHKMGEPKWEAMGLKSPFSHIASYPDEKAYRIQKLMEEAIQYRYV